MSGSKRTARHFECATLGVACVALLACSGMAPAEGSGGTGSNGTGGATSGGGGAGAGGGALTGGQTSVGGDAGAGGDAGEPGGGGTGASGDPTGGAGGDGGAAPGAGGTPMGMCGEPPLEVMGPAVVHSVANAPAPPEQGGALVDGLYDATTQVRYYSYTLPAQDPNFRQVLRIRDGGTTLEWFSVQQPAGPGFVSVQSQMVGITSSGSELIMAPICPNDGGGATFAMPYSARPGEIDLYVDYADGPETRYGVITHVLRQ